MFLKGVDDFLIGKDIGKYEIELSPEKAFGPRIPKLVQMVPMKIFKTQKLNPFPGAIFNFDGRVAKVLSVSGGRVLVDFNNPLAGKEVDYEFTIKRKVDDKKEKIDALQDFFFRQKFEFEIKDNKVIFKDAKIKPIVEMLGPKLKEISGYDFEVGEKEEKEKEDSKK